MRLQLHLGALASSQLAVAVAMQLVVIAGLGIGGQTDALIGIQAVPLVVFAAISNALQNVWQPRLAVLHLVPERRKHEVCASQGQVTLLFGAAALVLYVSRHAWICLLFPGFSPEQHALTNALLVPLLGAMLLNGHVALLTIAQRARDRFLGVEWVALLASVAAIGVVWVVVPRFGVESVAWTMLARAAVVYAVVFLLADRPVPSLNAGWHCSAVWHQVWPLLAGTSLYKTGPLVDRFWSSQAATGSVTLFSIAQSAMGALANSLDRAICVPATPQLGRLAESGDFSSVRAQYRRCILRVVLATSTIPLALLALAPVWGPLLRATLNLDAATASSIWVVCILLTGYLYVAAFGSIVNAAFYALGDARTPVRVGVTGFVFGIVVKSVAFLWLGLPGLALGTSLYYVLNMVVMCALLERKLNAGPG